MHAAGNKIIAKGFDQVVTITNYHDEPDHNFINIAKKFIYEMDFKLQDPEMLHYQCEWTWHDYDCIYCIQDGELQGLGIYVFFKTSEGAEECRKKYGQPTGT